MSVIEIEPKGLKVILLSRVTVNAKMPKIKICSLSTRFRNSYLLPIKEREPR